MQETTPRTDAAVRTVARRLRAPAGESLARRLLAAEYDPGEDRGLLVPAFAALRVVRRRLGHDVPSLGDGADALDVAPREVAAAERALVESLSPPADEDDRRRLSAAVRTARRRLREAETDAADADYVLPAETVAELRAHVDRLEADRSMARLGFRLYDVAHGTDAPRADRRSRSDPERA